MSVPVPETARYAVRAATATGAICRVPMWVVRAARRDQREWGNVECSGQGGEHRGEGEPIGQPWDQHVVGGADRTADEQHHEEGTADEAGGLAQNPGDRVSGTNTESEELPRPVRAVTRRWSCAIIDRSAGC
jgi:hypothetical protein